MTDEQAIRDLIATWQEASRTGNLSKLLELMTEDVVFLTPGQAPMNKETFAKGFENILEKMTIDSNGDVQEIVVTGNYAYNWSHLTVTMNLKNGSSVHRSGHTLTFFRKEQGLWKLARDANMLTTEAA
jgi:uncharacterized protein (TIGR02246 family)